MPTLPIGEWIRGPLYNWALDIINSLDPTRYNINEAVKLLNKHKTGEFNYTRDIRTLLMSSIWVKNLIN